jgi:hypothetical protein
VFNRPSVSRASAVPNFVRAAQFVGEGGGVLVVFCFVVAGGTSVTETAAAPMSPTVASGDGGGWNHSRVAD